MKIKTTCHGFSHNGKTYSYGAVIEVEKKDGVAAIGTGSAKEYFEDEKKKFVVPPEKPQITKMLDSENKQVEIKVKK